MGRGADNLPHEAVMFRYNAGVSYLYALGLERLFWGFGRELTGKEKKKTLGYFY